MVVDKYGSYNLFQNQKSTTCWIMLAEKKKSLEKV
jgi:hypothetical protein